MTRLFVSLVVAVALFISTSHARAALTLSYPTVTQSIQPNSGDLMTISCPAGSTVVSGGWQEPPAYGPYLAVWVSRQVANTWRVMTYNTHPTAILAITGYAVCASGVAGLTSYFSSQAVNVPAFSGITGSVGCSNGGFPTGGGFDSNFPKPSELIAHGSYPGFGNVWTTAEYNSTNQGKSFTAFVTCLKNLSGSVTPMFGNTVNFGNGASAELTLQCNFGDFAIGGGFYTSASGAPSSNMQTVRAITNRPNTTNTRRWLVRAYNSHPFEQAQVIPWVQCLHVN